MSLRTIICWAIYHPKRRRIVTGFRTRKDIKAYYTAGIPIGCLVVKMKGHYLRRMESPASGKGPDA